MTKKPKLIDWILCDDVRQEASGKTTIIGIYGADVIVPMTPMVLPQLCIITKWDTSSAIFKEIEFRLEMPDGNQMGPVKAKAPHNVKGERLSMHLAFIPFQIQVIGTYRLHIKIDDDTEKTIGKFEVKLSLQN